MEPLIPWQRLALKIEPHYLKQATAALIRYNDAMYPAMEDALYEIALMMRLFAGLSLDKPILDHSTILKFRHLLERHGLARKIFLKSAPC